MCDAATVDGAGKLNILGSFDRLSAASEPIVHMQCALALKLRFARIEEGQKRFRLTFVDSDGNAVMQPLDATTEVRFLDQDSTSTVSIALNIQQLNCRNSTSIRLISQLMNDTKRLSLCSLNHRYRQIRSHSHLNVANR